MTRFDRSEYDNLNYKLQDKLFNIWSIPPHNNYSIIDMYKNLSLQLITTHNKLDHTVDMFNFKSHHHFIE